MITHNCPLNVITITIITKIHSTIANTQIIPLNLMYSIHFLITDAQLIIKIITDKVSSTITRMIYYNAFKEIIETRVNHFNIVPDMETAVITVVLLLTALFKVDWIL